ncbi:hypothetical protein ABPG75_010907 [Micractinium tetrahymenae]
MQVFARLRPALLRRLRRVLQLAIPAAVAADTARSCVVTYQLAQQRFKEWEEEDQEATRHDVAELLRGVVRRCAAKDRDFWPAFEAAAASAAASASSSSSSDSRAGLPAGLPPGAAASASGAEGLAGDVWQLLGLHLSMAGSGGEGAAPAEEQQQAQAAAAVAGQHQPLAAGSTSLTAEHAAWAEAEAAQLLRHEQQAAEAAAAPHGVTAAAKAAAQARATLVVVTLGEALSHVASELAALGLPWTTLQSPPPGVVHVTLSDVARILAATPPARAAASRRERLCARLAAAADVAAESARSALPWPQLELSRRSALRYAVQWHGVSWPQAPSEPLERELSLY